MLSYNYFIVRKIFIISTNYLASRLFFKYKTDLKNIFEIIFKKERSESFRDIFREVYRDDYTGETNPDKFVTITDLRTVVKNLNVGIL